MVREVSDKVNNKIMLKKAREIEEGIWDLGAMWAKHMLIKGKEVLEHEVKEYLKDKLNNVSKWELK